MNTKQKYMLMAIVVVFTLALIQNASAGDLIVVASKATQRASMDWFDFLESKEIPVKKVTPDSFSNYKDKLYIIVLGNINESEEIANISKDALTKKEFDDLSKNNKGKMFYKPQAWNVGQKVILFLGPSLEAVAKARKLSRDDWFDKLKDWFEIDDADNFHVY